MPKIKQKLAEPIPKDLFEILACPLCKGNIEYAKDKKSLECSSCGKKFPIREGIPDFVVSKSI